VFHLFCPDDTLLMGQSGAAAQIYGAEPKTSLRQSRRRPALLWGRKNAVTFLSLRDLPTNTSTSTGKNSTTLQQLTQLHNLSLLEEIMTSSTPEDDAAEVLAGLGKAGPAANEAASPTDCTAASEASSDSTRRGGDHRAKSHPSSSSSTTSAPTAKSASEDIEVHQSVGARTAGSSSSAASLSSHDASSSAVSNSRFPVEARVVQFVKISKSRQDHSYRDYSIVPPPTDYQPPMPKKNDDESMDHMSFSEKLHDLLAQPAHRETIRWMSHGRAFRVEVPKKMEKHGILLRYFKHGRYSSFLRQLNNHGFKHLTVGPDRNSYYHEVNVYATSWLFVLEQARR
jgi:hypothetical protein